MKCDLAVNRHLRRARSALSGFGTCVVALGLVRKCSLILHINVVYTTPGMTPGMKTGKLPGIGRTGDNIWVPAVLAAVVNEF